jgi:hypothetical protein
MSRKKFAKDVMLLRLSSKFGERGMKTRVLPEGGTKPLRRILYTYRRSLCRMVWNSRGFVLYKEGLFILSWPESSLNSILQHLPVHAILLESPMA